MRKHPNKNKNKDELRLIHGLLHCKNGCGSWNRDRNCSSNIYKIANNAINNIDRPSYLCRKISNQSNSTSAYNQTLRRYEKRPNFDLFFSYFFADLNLQRCISYYVSGVPYKANAICEPNPTDNLIAYLQE